MIKTCTNILIHSRLSTETKFILCVHEFFSLNIIIKKERKQQQNESKFPNRKKSQKIDDPKRIFYKISQVEKFNNLF